MPRPEHHKDSATYIPSLFEQVNHSPELPQWGFPTLLLARHSRVVTSPGEWPRLAQSQQPRDSGLGLPAARSLQPQTESRAEGKLATGQTGQKGERATGLMSAEQTGSPGSFHHVFLPLSGRGGPLQ